MLHACGVPSQLVAEYEMSLIFTGERFGASDRSLTQLTTHVPVELRVEIRGVDAIGGGINP